MLDLENNIKIVNIEENLLEPDSSRFLQSDFWASFKAMHGWNKKRFNSPL